jgi:DNA-directed RNA polymerase beta' subunit
VNSSKEFIPENIRKILGILQALDKHAEDIALLGFEHGSKPSFFIFTILLVLPPIQRPPRYEDGQRIEDGFTMMYAQIIKSNNEYAKYSTEIAKLEAQGKILDPSSDLVKNLVSTEFNLAKKVQSMIDNKDKWFKASKNKVFDSTKDYIQGKEAVIRAGIMGKRTDYFGRTVVGPGADLRFDQVGIPAAMAAVLTRPIVIFANNQAKMQKFLKEGKINAVRVGSGPKRGVRITINEKNRDKITLQLGDTVDCQLQNGDWVTVNRQPTLHKQSMLSMRVVIYNDDNIKLHIGHTKGFNADHDGDWALP